MPGIKCSELLDKMCSIIQHGVDDLAPFSGFFFDIWSTGRKQSFDKSFSHTFPDIKCAMDKEDDPMFVDVGAEVMPTEKLGLLAIPYAVSPVSLNHFLKCLATHYLTLQEMVGSYNI